MEVIPKNIIHEGARLKQIVRDKHMKILDFARKAHFSNQIAHYYFRQEAIKRTKLQEFCNLLGISLDEFYAWTHPRRVLSQPATDLHQGHRLDELIEEKGLNKTRLANRMNLSRRALYNLIEKPVFTPEQLKKVCQVLEISAKDFLGANHVDDNDPEAPEIESWKDKYYKLLEDYNKALVEISRLREQTRS
ncbi:helix-turn-helix transcriptional regulator [Chitinophaga sp. YIM B06452]|uniref:helix-turn-helix transcriptional regulator n=1 Tax=Chitinophaga sp. YIM B06452 TaxID=3082158 RepID=UPI0031FF1733